MQEENQITAEKAIIKEALSEIIQKYIEQNIITIPTEISIIVNQIIDQSPSMLTNIIETIIEIVKDGKIDSNDIPRFIIVVQQLFQFVYSLKSLKLKTIKCTELTGEVLKYIIKVLVIERKVLMEKDNELDKLVDSCITLLSYSKILKPKKCLHF